MLRQAGGAKQQQAFLALLGFRNGLGDKSQCSAHGSSSSSSSSSTAAQQQYTAAAQQQYST
jgi:hypothetical protein